MNLLPVNPDNGLEKMCYVHLTAPLLGGSAAAHAERYAERGIIRTGWKLPFIVKAVTGSSWPI